MKKSLCHYSVPFFQKGDVVYDENFHLLLVVTHVMHNPTLPVFKVLYAEIGTFSDYNYGYEMPLEYSAETNSLQYVCKISYITRIRNHYKIYHRLPDSRVGKFLWNFKALRACQE